MTENWQYRIKLERGRNLGIVPRYTGGRDGDDNHRITEDDATARELAETVKGEMEKLPGIYEIEIRVKERR